MYQGEEELNISDDALDLIETSDPLANVGSETADYKFYRVDCVVFAEPLVKKNAFNRSSEEYSDCNEVAADETLTIDNVIVKKRKGRNKKYYINFNNASSITCPQQYCKKPFTTMTLLKSHIRKVHCSDKDYMCEHCAARFTAQYLLNRHYAVHGEERVQCPVCNKMLSKRTNLQAHLRSHADTRPHACALCGRRFLRQSTLKVHLKSVHKEPAG